MGAAWRRHRGVAGLSIRARVWVSRIALAGLALALTACGPGFNTGADQNRTLGTAICASPDTAAAVRDMIFADAEKQTNPANRLALTQLAKQAALRIDLPALVSYDDTSRRTTCQGQLHLILPTGAVRNLGDAGDIVLDAKYTAQPANDDTGMNYKVIGAESVVSGIAAADISDWAAKLQAGATMRETPPPAAPAPSAAPRPATVAAAATPAKPAPTSPQPAPEAKRPAMAGLAPLAPAPGFGPPLVPRCGWARSYADRTICGDPVLEAEDRRIQRMFRAALAQDDTGEVRRTAQSERGDREGCQDRDCIMQWFRQREADLSPR